MAFSEEIALTREESWQRYAALLDIDVDCEACAAPSKAIFMHGFDLATREAVGRTLHILFQEGMGFPPPEVQARIDDEFGLTNRGRHR